MLLPYKQNFMVPPAMPENRQSREYCEFYGPWARKTNYILTSDIVSTIHAIGAYVGPDRTMLCSWGPCWDSESVHWQYEKLKHEKKAMPRPEPFYLACLPVHLKEGEMSDESKFHSCAPRARVAFK